MPSLIITADDYGYAPSYDAGIAEAVRAGAIDSVSAMVMRYEPDPGQLDGAGVEVGLHLDPGAPLVVQLRAFEAIFGREPAYLDGHHHCHARGRRAVEVADLARHRGLPVRSVDARHRRLLRCKGVPTPDRLVGRLSERERPLPDEIRALRAGAGPEGVTEWMVHPGHAEPTAESAYDQGRDEDLRVLLALAEDPQLRRVRTNHAALG